MKNTAYFINVGRGKVWPDRRSGGRGGEREIAGAGLDVFEEEPLPSEHKLSGGSAERVDDAAHSGEGRGEYPGAAFSDHSGEMRAGS